MLGNSLSNFSNLFPSIESSLTSENFCISLNALKEKIPLSSNFNHIRSFIDNLIQHSLPKFSNQYSNSTDTQQNLNRKPSSDKLPPLTPSHIPKLFEIKDFNEFVTNSYSHIKSLLGNQHNSFDSYLFNLKNAHDLKEFCISACNLKNLIQSNIPNSFKIVKFIDWLINHTNSKFLIHTTSQYDISTPISEQFQSPINQNGKHHPNSKSKHLNQSNITVSSSSTPTNQKNDKHQQVNYQNQLNETMNKQEEEPTISSPLQTNQNPYQVYHHQKQQISSHNINFESANSIPNLKSSNINSSSEFLPQESKNLNINQLQPKSTISKEMFSELEDLNISGSSESKNSILLKIIKLFKNIILSTLPRQDKT
jgi:hypothetical protein